LTTFQYVSGHVSPVLSGKLLFYNDCKSAPQHISTCPIWAPVFTIAFRYFNSIQSECFEALFRNDHSVIIAAPTGGGKTVALELAILHLLSRYIDPVSGQFHHRPGQLGVLDSNDFESFNACSSIGLNRRVLSSSGLLKVIYLAPAKALVSEKVQEWKARFGSHLGVKIKELTGKLCMPLCVSGLPPSPLCEASQQ
jgi:ATP-dependent DNA helicase HFM1/MER3